METRGAYNFLVNAAILLRILALSAAELLLRGVETLVDVVFFLSRARGLLRGIAGDGAHICFYVSSTTASTEK